ncbi:hypothetical protein EJ06DRAFT_559105 [Trichodelitschia bisporula]|uniref:Uncharacterized protein n=1 Tax=Trichodelitschia bisporula TaxID=703511 RepID=A0A6G1HNR7_9PEZI|nr:hypothetical protein EJ06DRAFT_559105 [Trichodelitschia bisporula]
MCHMEHILHTCGHWGPERFIGEPCVRSRTSDGHQLGCLYKELLGMANSDAMCRSCQRLADRPPLYNELRKFSFGSTSTVAISTWDDIVEKKSLDPSRRSSIESIALSIGRELRNGVWLWL